MQEIQAAIHHAPGQPLAIETVTIDDPGPGEVLIATVATGVCHSDVHVIDGSVFGGRPPVAGGHEGAGIVEAIGVGVTHVQPGDHVVTCLSGFCGQCEQCLGGHPNLCTGGTTRRPRGADPRLVLGGERVLPMAGIGSWAEKMLVHENSLVRIDDDIPLDVACLVGCGVLTGVGAVLRTAEVRPGDAVAVFGCGGVGLSVVQGAAIARAGRIIAIDQVSEKLDMALTLGATDVIDASKVDDIAGAVRDLTAGRGVEHAFEAVGLPSLVRLASETLAVRGTCTIVGVPPDGSVFEIPYAAIRLECRVQTCRMGSNRFRTDIPRYLDFYRSGLLALDELVTSRAPLSTVNDAVAAMQAGRGTRSVLTFDVAT